VRGEYWKLLEKRHIGQFEEGKKEQRRQECDTIEYYRGGERMVRSINSRRQVVGRRENFTSLSSSKVCLKKKE